MKNYTRIFLTHKVVSFHRFLALPLFGIFFLSGCPFDNNKVFHNSDFLLAISEEGLKYQSVPLGSLPKLTTHSDVPGKRAAYFVDDIGFILVEAEAAINANLLSDLNNSSINFINENLILYTHSENNHEFIKIFQNMKPALSLNQTGIFKYPLVLCLFLAVFIFTERFYSLRRGLTFPRKVEKALQNGEFPDKRWKKRSAAERIVYVAINEHPSQEALLSYARLEIAAMEKGLYLLEAIIAGAPLIGLLGTATGLVQVFSVLPSTGLSGGTEIFSEGIALALLTTIIGLGIAIPSLLGHAFLVRVIEKRSASLDWLTARLIDATIQNKVSFSPK